ncbi:MAG TPA: hypothetical protein DC024_09100, partial [Clostridiales bacterium]|nr:hypothetical protein [Clostridiales bacterium]
VGNGRQSRYVYERIFENEIKNVLTLFIKGMGTHLYYGESLCGHEECPRIYKLCSETARTHEILWDKALRMTIKNTYDSENN